MGRHGAVLLLGQIWAAQRSKKYHKKIYQKENDDILLVSFIGTSPRLSSMDTQTHALRKFPHAIRASFLFFTHQLYFFCTVPRFVGFRTPKPPGALGLCRRLSSRQRPGRGETCSRSEPRPWRHRDAAAPTITSSRCVAAPRRFRRRRASSRAYLIESDPLNEARWVAQNLNEVCRPYVDGTPARGRLCPRSRCPTAS